ncbi:MAG TPA: TonB-dependent receptor [Pyrinomonadaceae bacterium]|nr:TonB-dependent receptor [Pyrinomonadaceae bacterium]
MRTVVLVISVLVFTASAFGQQTGGITGSYWERGPVVGTEIRLINAERTLTTRTTQSTNGASYFFENVPVGNYTLSAPFGWTLENVKIEPSRVLIVNIDVSSQPSYTSGLGYVTVIATGSLQGDTQVSKTVDVIESQELRDRADFTLIDTVRTIPGFRVQQLGGFGRTASIKSRGLRNQDTAVLLDGIRFRDPGSITGDATPFLSDLTLTSVNRIDVLRGSGSSLYGTNAVGGTLNFQTPVAQKGIHGQVSGAAGALGLGRFRGNLSYGNDDFGIGGGISRTSYAKGIDGNDDANNTNVQTRADFNPFQGTRFSGRVFLSDADVRLNTSPETFGPVPPLGTTTDAREGVNFLADQDDPDSRQDSRFVSGQFSATQVITASLFVRGSYQGLVTKRTNQDGPLGSGFQSAFTSSFGGTLHTADVNVHWNPTSSNEFTGGYEFELEHFRNAGSTPSATDDFWTRAAQRSNTLYAHHLFRAFDGRLTVAGGVRAQWFSLSAPEFSAPDSPYADFGLSDPPAAYTFDGSASYYFERTGTKIRAHVGNGYRVPSLYERFGTFFFFGSFFPQGNPDLKPEHSLGIDAGVEQYFVKRKVRASFTWFYTRVKDEITYLPTDDFSAPVYYNFDRHFSRGVEATVEVKPTRSTDIFWSYTFTNSDVRNFRRPFGIVVPISSENRVYGIPNHQFTAVLTQRFGRFWVSGDLLATSSYVAPVFNNTTFASFPYRFEGNRRVDVTAGYTFPLKGDGMNLRLFGTLENVLDNKYYENGFRTPGINGRAGLSFVF